MCRSPIFLEEDAREIIRHDGRQRNVRSRRQRRTTHEI
jgi:hypothetical protein